MKIYSTTTRLLSAFAVTLGVGFATQADASHGRGAAVIPSIDSNGLLTIQMISYWDPTGVSEPGSVNFSISGAGAFNANGAKSFSDFSDIRREEHYYTATQQLTGSGLYSITWSGCCMTGGINNTSGTGYGTTSTIYWDGQNATQPIFFDLENIQQEVPRGQAYSDNLDAVAGGPLTLSYVNSTSSYNTSGITPPGYSVDATGQINISAADTAGYNDNTSNPPGGADWLFSGKIVANDGNQDVGSIEYYWLFDGVDQTGPGNRAPTVSDIIINATLGDTINTIVTATDPDGDPVTLSFDSFLGLGNPMNQVFDPNTGAFSWDSTGFSVGSYVAAIQGTDPGGLSDIGTITINLTQGGGPNVVPLPAGGWLLLSGLAGLALQRRRRR